jgi:hypothetical protein
MMINKAIKYTIAATLITVLGSGCNSTTVENASTTFVDDQFLVDIPDATIMPSDAALKGKRIRVVVLDTKTNSTANFEKGAIRGLSAKLENGLINAGVEIIDRSLAGKLGDEITVYETTGKFSGAGLNVADIAIFPSVSNVQVSSGYTQSKSGTNDGERYTIPAKCTYNGTVSGNVKLYRLPDLELVEGITLEGKYNSSGAVGSRSCPISSTLASSLASSAIADAIDESINLVQSHMAGSSYVIEYRKRDNDHYALISMGSSSGLKKGQKIKFVKKVKTKQTRLRKSKVVEIPYGFSGTVSNVIEADSAWIIVDEAAEAELKFGDVAKKLFEEQSILDKIKSKAGL